CPAAGPLVKKMSSRPSPFTSIKLALREADGVVVMSGKVVSSKDCDRKVWHRNSTAHILKCIKNRIITFWFLRVESIFDVKILRKCALHTGFVLNGILLF